MTHEDVAEVGAVHQRVVDGKDRAARQAEDVGDTEQLEGADDRLRAREHGR